MSETVYVEEDYVAQRDEKVRRHPRFKDRKKRLAVGQCWEAHNYEAPDNRYLFLIVAHFNREVYRFQKLKRTQEVGGAWVAVKMFTDLTSLQVVVFDDNGLEVGCENLTFFALIRRRQRRGPHAWRDTLHTSEAAHSDWLLFKISE